MAAAAPPTTVPWHFGVLFIAANTSLAVGSKRVRMNINSNVLKLRCWIHQCGKIVDASAVASVPVGPFHKHSFEGCQFLGYFPNNYFTDPQPTPVSNSRYTLLFPFLIAPILSLEIA